MVASPNVNPNAIAVELERLRTQIVKLGGKTLDSANIGSGGITVNGGSITISGSGGIKLPIGGTITDSNGVVLLQSDPAGGMAYPWEALDVVQVAQGSTGTAPASCFYQGSFVTSPQALNTAVSGLLGGNHYFMAGVPSVTHPRIQYRYWEWQVGTAITSVSWVMELLEPPNYTTVGTSLSWTATPTNAGGYDTQIMDVSAFLGQNDLVVGIRPTAIVKSSDTGFGMQPFGMFLRGTV